MASRRVLSLSLGLVATLGIEKSNGSPEPRLNVDWASFLSRSDLVYNWTTLDINGVPDKWYHAAFQGNGAQGLMVRATKSAEGIADGLRIDVGHSGVYDDRTPKSGRGNFVCDRPRLPIGMFLVHFAAPTLESLSMRLSLYDAVLSGTATTALGRCDFKSFVNADYGTADASAIRFNCSGGERARIEWAPSLANSTWAGSRCPGYVYNPKPKTEAGPAPGGSYNITTTTQAHLSGTSHATAFAALGTETDKTLYIAVANVSRDSPERAVGYVGAAVAQGWDEMRSSHTRWWHNWWPASFLTLSDSVIESFYWANMYKLASATRADRNVYDLMGPWYIDGTNWPDLHWDLNVQLTYWPLFTANRLDLVESLTSLLKRETDNLIQNVDPAFRNDSAAAPSGASSMQSKETCYWNYGKDCLVTPPTVTGNLAWAMQLWHQLWQFSGDLQVLREAYPLLRRSVNFYANYQQRNDSDPYWHLPPTLSPEYKVAPDTNYDLSLYRYALTALIEAIDTLKIADPRRAEYQEFLQNLSPPPSAPVGSQYPGFWIGRGVPLSSGHRHFSHLFMIFPLKQLNFSDAGDLAMAEASVDHWLGLTTGLTGFCRTASSSMNVILDRRQAALTNLTYLLDSWILPNTMYHEGENGECGETPPAASSSIQDWLLLEWNQKLHVFAGVYDGGNNASERHLADASFYRLRAPGALLVSARRVKGKTLWVSVENARPDGSEAVVTLVTDLAENAQWLPKSAKVTPGPNGEFTVTVPSGDVVSIVPAGPVPDLVVSPSTGEPENFNLWGFPGPNGVRPQGCDPSQSVEGYACVSNACGTDDDKEQSQCGSDLCNPISNVTLCSGIPAKGALKEAAARCAAVNCSAFAMNPIWDACNHSSGQVCAKFFSASGRLLPAKGGWTAWVRDVL